MGSAAPTRRRPRLRRPPPPRRAPRRGSGAPVTLVFGGDVHFEGSLRGQLDANPSGMFNPIRDLLTGADVAIVNLETADRDRRIARSEGVQLPGATGGVRSVAGRGRGRGLDGEQPRTRLRPGGPGRDAGSEAGDATRRARDRGQRRGGLPAVADRDQGSATRGVRCHRRARRLVDRVLDGHGRPGGPGVEQGVEPGASPRRHPSRPHGRGHCRRVPALGHRGADVSVRRASRSWPSRWWARVRTSWSAVTPTG